MMRVLVSGVAWGIVLALAACGGGEARFHPTIAEPPRDLLSDVDVEGCAVYLEERCQGGRQERCEIYDTAAGDFVDSPDPLLHRVYLYDRWYDLYASPNGLTAERVFNGPVAGDAPEGEWGDPGRFSSYAGEGDAAIWTGAALNAAAFRYARTGTAADLARMEDILRALLRDFEVTGVPGYLARHHYLRVPAGTPVTDRVSMRFGDPAEAGPYDHVIDSPESIAGLPEEYAIGVMDGSGGRVQGTPMWHGHPSIDQYTGPMTAFPTAYFLTRDPALRQAIVTHLTCYLKRLQRLEIRNLQSNPEVLAELTTYFAGAGPNFDPDDIDLTALDTLVAYVHPDLNRNNAAGFDRTCPASMALTATRVIDAGSQSFMTDMLDLASDLANWVEQPRMTQIDHFYIVNVRGGDASHLIHLAVIAFLLTGEEQYLRFLDQELIASLRAPEVALTMMAFRLPDWCFRFYGDHITYQTHWQLLTMLGDSPLKDTLVRVMEEEVWQKALRNHHNAKFEVMYASTVPEGVATGRSQASASLVTQLQELGGNGGELVAPRRTYTRARQEVIDGLPAGVTVRCPTEEQRRQCEEGGTIFGIPLEQSQITRACDGRPGECVMQDGLCADGIASEGLPASLRTYADFLWQRSPFDIGEQASVEGQRQSPGSDLSEPYWLARHYGFITTGEGQALAWRDIGACP